MAMIKNSHVCPLSNNKIVCKINSPWTICDILCTDKPIPTTATLYFECVTVFKIQINIEGDRDSWDPVVFNAQQLMVCSVQVLNSVIICSPRVETPHVRLGHCGHLVQAAAWRSCATWNSEVEKCCQRGDYHHVSVFSRVWVTLIAWDGRHWRRTSQWFWEGTKRNKPSHWMIRRFMMTAGSIWILESVMKGGNVITNWWV